MGNDVQYRYIPSVVPNKKFLMLQNSSTIIAAES
uniref:Uncharacterized protein MANES_10G139100 n=1 Tax=Rhizophora mucronata TaxID=61149 RepID=A0A2P2LT66_RHIMU